MIILSQDKTATTQNLDLGIDYTYNESGEFPDLKKEIVNYCIVDRKYNTILAEYSTEKRAKEVLQEIISRYEYAQRNLADSNDTSPYNEVFVYKMPQE